MKASLPIAQILCLLLVLTNFIACSRTVVKEGTIYATAHTVTKERGFKITLKVYNDPEIDYSLLRTFRLEFKASDHFNPLLDKHIRSLLRENLLQRGFVEQDQNPDFIVMGTHQNVFVPDRDPGIRSESGSYSGYVGGQYFSGTYHSGDGLVTAIVKAKKAQRYWVHEFGLVFFNPSTNEVVWIATASAYVRVDDVRETAPGIIDVVLDNYPAPKEEKK